MKTITFSLLLVLSAGQILAQKNISTVELEKQVSLTAKIENFDSSKHIYDTCDTGLGWKSICLIDGKVWFGSDGGMELPKNQLISLTLYVNGNKPSLMSQECTIRSGKMKYGKTSLNLKRQKSVIV